MHGDIKKYDGLLYSSCLVYENCRYDDVQCATNSEKSVYKTGMRPSCSVLLLMNVLHDATVDTSGM